MKEDQELLEGVLHRPDGVFSESWWPIFTQLPRVDILGNSEAENLLVVLRAVGHGGTFK
jgi:hypothetical protein